MFSLVPERLSASQAATQKQRLEAKREQDDEHDLKAGERMWRAAKELDAAEAVTALLDYVKACRAVIDAGPDNKADLRDERRRLAAVVKRAQPRVREVAYRGHAPALSHCNTLPRRRSRRRSSVVWRGSPGKRRGACA